MQEKDTINSALEEHDYRIEELSTENVSLRSILSKKEHDLAILSAGLGVIDAASPPANAHSTSPQGSPAVASFESELIADLRQQVGFSGTWWSVGPSQTCTRAQVGRLKADNAELLKEKSLEADDWRGQIQRLLRRNK
eukprot:SAG31_NODE_1380_length_8582_cov_4.390192_5_plen_137_part_01